MRDRDEPSLPVHLVALSGYGAYRAAFPTDTPTWEQLAEHDRQSWLSLAGWILSLPAELDGIAFSDAAARAHARTWADKKTWRTMLLGERIAFEAATRHMVALADSGLPDEELDEAEAKWGPWAKRQRPATPVVEHVT